MTAKVDHCNAVLYGLPKYKIERLQYALNSAARLVTLTHKHDHITPVLMELDWLPVEQRIEYKILLYTNKVLHGVAPHYLNELLEFYRPDQQTNFYARPSLTSLRRMATGPFPSVLPIFGNRFY